MDFRHRRPDPQGQRRQTPQGSRHRVQNRAQLATDALGGKGYKIVNLELNSNGYQPYLRAPMMKARRWVQRQTPES